MKTITLLIFKLLLDAGVVVPMNQTNDGRELYTLFPNANSVALEGIGLTIIDAQEEGTYYDADEKWAFLYLDESMRLQELPTDDTSRAVMFDHCYKGEILNWIQTLEFSYNEEFSDEPVKAE
tara:strand:- start:1206 stop:1571 length:366 start_codon:yes stop_codon:yes gene_type:complete